MSAIPAAQRLILNFHGVGRPWPGVPEDEVPYWCPVDEWYPIADALADLHGAGGTPLEITFDDGNRSDVDVVLPSLIERGLNATFFLCAGRLGTPHYLDDADVRELTGAGMGIGSHGWGHVDLRRADEAELLRETRESQLRLEEAAGERVVHFAIPFGSYDRRVLKALRRYHAVFSSDGGMAPARAWFSPRTSYVRGWAPAEPGRLAGRQEAMGARLRRRLVTTLKRWR